MPLDVCAFIGKEIASALDHAHRKRDHTGKSLGIVHRDVSPQNVLVSYSGEVKLVDFGIAKATMKARQTAVGVIKGKYYYMSPEQAWGDPIDYRSDIFSAGIVLYEMITGQMLYLEEDLHKLLEMARAADIAPPSKLRRGRAAAARAHRDARAGQGAGRALPERRRLRDRPRALPPRLLAGVHRVEAVRAAAPGGRRSDAGARRSRARPASSSATA